MHLFFFVSGFVAYKAHPDKTWLVDKSLVRFFKQFLPTIIIGLIFVTWYDQDYDRFLYANRRHGYWFTITAFETFIVYALTNFTLEKFRATNKTKLIAYGTIMLVTAGASVIESKADHHWFGEIKVLQLIGVYELFRHMAFFFLGVICKMYFDKFMNLIKNNWFMTVVVVIATVLYVFFPRPGFRLYIAPLAILIIFRMIYTYRDTFSSQTRAGRTLMFIGKNTLPIYLLHYFFIYNLEGLQGTAFANAVRTNPTVELLVCIPLSLLIAYACILIDKAITAIPPVHAVLLGDYPWKFLKRDEGKETGTK